MRLDDYIEELEPDEEAKRRRLAKEKSYEITDHLEEFEQNFEQALSGDTLVGSTAPSIFVGRSNYPDIPVGVLSPVGDENAAEDYVTDGNWYQQGYDIPDVLQRRTGLLNSNKRANVDSPSIASRLTPNVHDAWDGFVGVQREVAIADRPVDLEIGLDDTPDLGLDTGTDVATPRGPRANARNAELRENPYVPKPIKKTLEDDDWQAQGAMTYLYRRGFGRLRHQLDPLGGRARRDRPATARPDAVVDHRRRRHRRPVPPGPHPQRAQRRRGPGLGQRVHG